MARQWYLGGQGVRGGGPANWAKKWTDLLYKVLTLPDINTTAGPVRVRDRVLVDVLNEPDCIGIECARASRQHAALGPQRPCCHAHAPVTHEAHIHSERCLQLSGHGCSAPWICSSGGANHMEVTACFCLLVSASSEKGEAELAQNPLYCQKSRLGSLQDIPLVCYKIEAHTAPLRLTLSI